MEKLLELLNEYETPRSWVVYKSYDDYDWFFYWVDCDWETEIAWSDSLICSKKFWFIKWLVDNEKIDFRKLDCKRYDVDIPARYYLWTYIRYSIEKEMLMTLVIQDEPIKFLISLLKNVEKSD